MNHRFLCIALLLVCIGCNNESSKTATSDTSSAKSDSSATPAVAKIDTIKGPIDSTKTMVVTKLDLQGISCDSVTTLLGNKKLKNPSDDAFLAMKQMDCNNADWNAKRPDSPIVTIAVQDVSEGQNRVLFNTMSAKTAEDIGKVTKNLITLGAAIESDGDVEITTVATIAGNYTVDAYIEAAKNNDPLIFIYPGAIPAKTLTMDTYRTLTQGAPFRPAEYVINGVVSVTKVVVLPAKVAVDAGKKAAQIAIIGPAKKATALVKKLKFKK